MASLSSLPSLAYDYKARKAVSGSDAICSASCLIPTHFIGQWNEGVDYDNCLP